MAPPIIIALAAWAVGIHPHLSAKAPRLASTPKSLTGWFAPARRAEVYLARMALLWVDAVSLDRLTEGGGHDVGERERWVLQVAKLH
ncbi:hypothetical protein CT0861_12796 [Colletotrichum tofieldiae]|uniref:Uncharacterized protein n=1 Tax=Colletotrichum tofieldiae TaxID=708197 RepID=A0A161VG56_9PEZI|nr:hypothetical protein CT0861_12796 [Colletotrichum tofieldiae]